MQRIYISGTFDDSMSNHLEAERTSEGFRNDEISRTAIHNSDKSGLNDGTSVKPHISEKHGSSKSFRNGEECDICGKMLRYGNLKRHRRLHTGEMPYTCGTCLKKFSDASNYVKHLRLRGHKKPPSSKENS